MDPAGESKKDPVYDMERKNNEAGQERMANAYFELGKRIHATVAPVGLVWWKLFHSHPEIELYITDGQHASPAGSLVAAYTIFSAITGKQAKATEPLDRLISRSAYETVLTEHG